MMFENLRVFVLFAALGATACASGETVTEDDQSEVVEASIESSESEGEVTDEPAPPDGPNVAVTRVLRAELRLKQGPFPQPWTEKK